jgi:hypothetical protein
VTDEEIGKIQAHAAWAHHGINLCRNKRAYKKSLEFLRNEVRMNRGDFAKAKISFDREIVKRAEKDPYRG